MGTQYSIMTLVWKLLLLASPVLGALGISYTMPSVDQFLAGWLPILCGIGVAAFVGIRNMQKHWLELTKQHPDGQQFKWLAWGWKILLVLVAPVLMALVPGSSIDVPGDWNTFYQGFTGNWAQLLIGLGVLVFKAVENIAKNWKLISAQAVARLVLVGFCASMAITQIACVTTGPNGEIIKKWTIDWEQVQKAIDVLGPYVRQSIDMARDYVEQQQTKDDLKDEASKERLMFLGACVAAGADYAANKDISHAEETGNAVLVAFKCPKDMRTLLTEFIAKPGGPDLPSNAEIFLNILKEEVGKK